MRFVKTKSFFTYQIPLEGKIGVSGIFVGLKFDQIFHFKRSVPAFDPLEAALLHSKLNLEKNQSCINQLIIILIKLKNNCYVHTSE